MALSGSKDVGGFSVVSSDALRIGLPIGALELHRSWIVGPTPRSYLLAPVRGIPMAVELSGPSPRKFESA
eukprot:15479123-Alexandrium_andersonii.AAC.1